MSETTIPNLYLPPEIMTDDRLTLRHIRVLMAIFSWRKANTNLARVSRQMISDRTGYPLSRISTITTELEKLEWISKSGNGGKSQWTEYRVKELKDFKKPTKAKGDQNGNGYQNGNGNQNGNETVTDSVTQTVTKTVRGIDTGVITGKEQCIDKPKKSQPEIINSFFPVERSSQALRDKYPNINESQALAMIDSFKDKMLNRKASWKDIQSTFRTYVREEYIKPPKVKIVDEPTLTFSQINKLAKAKQQQIKNNQQPKPVDVSRLTNKIKVG